jgi:hypothetical protein
MTCTKCHQPIEGQQPYHRTAKGPHHFRCPVEVWPEDSEQEEDTLS